MKKALFIVSTALAGASSALAQTTQIIIGNTAQQGAINGGALVNLLGLAQTLVSRAVPFLVGVAVVVFFYFLIMFIVRSSDSAKRADYLKGMGLSIVAIFVMVSIWGIVGLAGSIFGIGQGGNIPTPGVPVPAN